MGVYVYCTKPSHVATAEVRLADGTLTTAEVALYRYAYKPTYSGWDAEKTNQRWRFKSGAAACSAAYARSGRDVPAFGTHYDEERHEVYAAGRTDANGLFLTKGAPEVYDDCTEAAPATLVRWLSLPKGLTEGRQPLDRRLTPTTVLEYAPRPLSACQGTLSYWVRLADRATGEAQPEWTLCSSAERMVEHAARYGVPLAKAADDASGVPFR